MQYRISTTTVKRSTALIAESGFDVVVRQATARQGKHSGIPPSNFRRFVDMASNSVADRPFPQRRLADPRTW
jgi:hypothetical protein